MRDQKRGEAGQGYGRVFRTSRDIAVVMGLLAAVLTWSVLESVLAGMLPWALQNILAGLAFVLTFGLAWGGGVVGGTLGWFAGRRRGKGELGYVAGVLGFWVGWVVGLAALLALSESGAPGWVTALLVLGLPLMGPWVATRWIAEPTARIWSALRVKGMRLSRTASERLNVTRPLRLDARGLMMGLLAGLLAECAALVGALAYPEAIVLAQRIRFRNEPINTSAGPVELSRILSIGTWANWRGVRDRGIVLLQIDDWTQARLMTATSESAVNARMLRQLAKWGTRQVVLPITPSALAVTADGDRPDPGANVPPRPPAAPSGPGRPHRDVDIRGTASLNPANPPLDQPALERGRRDLPELVAALRVNPHAMLCLLPRPAQPAPSWLPPELRPGNPVVVVSQEMLASLLAAGRPVGTAEFSPFYVRQVQSLRIVDDRGRWALPLLLATGGDLSRVTPRPSPKLEGELKIGGRALRLAAPGELLVNVYGSRPGAIFPHISYSAVLNRARLYDPREGRWVPPERFFRNRIVFLDTLNQPSYDTPVGAFRATELLATATDNVFTLNTLSPPSPDLELCLLLFFGALAGHLSIGRSPLEGAARVVALIVLYGLASALLFAFAGVWLPTVSVTLGSAFAYLLVIQFVFSADEMELERQRAERGQLEQEVAISRAIQTSLLPAGHLRSGAFEIVSRSEPAREVGGDFFNLFPLMGPGSRVAGHETGKGGSEHLPSVVGSSLSSTVARDPGLATRDPLPTPWAPAGTRDCIGIVLGDVSGKGVQGAMYMTVATTLVEARAEAGVGPEEVLAIANAHLYPKIHRLRMFVTVFYGMLDVGTGELVFASAGQVPPVLSHGGETGYQPTRGIPLGAMQRSRYVRQSVRLEPGDTLVLASDGFIEATSARGEILGYDGFRDIVARHAAADPHACLEGVFHDVHAFSGSVEEQDDRTLVVIRHHAVGELDGDGR